MISRVLVGISAFLAGVTSSLGGSNNGDHLPPDHFTEIFESGRNDLGFVSLTFIPEESEDGYSLYLEAADEFPVDPARDTVLPLEDDQWAKIRLSGSASVKLYGKSYNEFFVGSNGYITFLRGDGDDTESLEDHFALPRISALFNTLVPIGEGVVSWGQLSDRVVVTFEDVPEYGLDNRNDFQIEMFFNGVIRLTYLDMGAYYGLAGLSDGGGFPAEFIESDLSKYPYGVPDADGDGLPDFWENLHGLDAARADAMADPDADGLSNLEEYVYATDPNLGSPGVTKLSAPAEPESIAYFSSTEVWVNFYNVGFGTGDITNPFNKVAEGAEAVTAGGIVRVQPGKTDEAPRLDKPMTLTAEGGLVRLGVPDSLWEASFPAYISSYVASCQNNLKQVGIVLSMFANESSGGYYPAISTVPGNLMFKETGSYPVYGVYPDYLTDPDILLCPARPDEEPPPYFTDEHYVYPGYLLMEDQDVLAFASAYATEIASGGNFSTDLPGTTSYGSSIERMQSGVEQLLVADINNAIQLAIARSTIPVMFDWPHNHQEAWGGNVLYMDGHVEWRHYPDEFPMTETAISALAAISGYTPPTEWREPDPDSPYGSAHDPYDFVASCTSNLSALGIAYKMFSWEASGNRWPRLSSEGGRLMFAEEENVYPEYMPDSDTLICPGAAPITPVPYLDDQHYAYLGYLMTCDQDVVAFGTAYAAQIAASGDFSNDLDAPNSYGDTLYRLREGIERFLITDINNPAASFVAASQIPVTIEWPGNHESLTGGHVLYMDGHVEWHDYPGEWPMTETTIGVLAGLASWTPTVEYADPVPAYTLYYDPYGFASDCAGNCKQMGLVCKMFANESSGEVWPPLSSESGRLMMDDAAVFPEYASDAALAICPGPAPVTPEPFFDDQHYVYLGYVLKCEEDVTAFVAGYADEIAAGGDFTDDLPVTSSYGDSILRLREGIGFFLITDINNPAASYLPASQIPVVIEWPGNHENLTGGHVLYMDGHVEWHDYPGEWPMTTATIGALSALAGWTPATSWSSLDYTLYNDSQDRALCAYNMKYVMSSVKMFTNYYNGYYPQLTTAPTTLMFTESPIYPHYLDDLRRLNCPGSAEAGHAPEAGDHSYFYTGYLLVDDDDVATFALAHAAELSGEGDFSGNLSYGGETLYRLREGVERFLITDINDPASGAVPQSQIPVLIEWPDNHGTIRGGNVAYMDGHTEWLDYPGEFPMTEASMGVFTALAGRSPIAD